MIRRLGLGGAIGAGTGAALLLFGILTEAEVAGRIGGALLLVGIALVLGVITLNLRAVKRKARSIYNRLSGNQPAAASDQSTSVVQATATRRGFPSAYPVRPVDRRQNGDRLHLLMGVTTWNRILYLQRFIETFDSTRNPAYTWTLVVADDGSTDGTLDYLRDLEIDGCTVVVVANQRRTIAGQTNSLLATALLVNPDLAFKADDDTFFAESGWDDLYMNAVRSSGFDHLIYHNAEWKPPHHELENDGLKSSVGVLDAMGCFYTFTPRVVADIGYFDEVNFPVRGHSHIDWSARACRAGYNEEQHVWDAAGSGRHIAMWQGAEYASVVNWGSAAVQAILTKEETQRRMSLLQQPDRIYVEHLSPQEHPRLPETTITPFNQVLASLLREHGIGDTG